MGYRIFLASADGARAVTVRGVAALEACVLNSPPLMGVVLRYGQLYGPETGSTGPRGASPVHVDAAAYAAMLALGRGAGGLQRFRAQRLPRHRQGAG
jgi:hypothetical protein